MTVTEFKKRVLEKLGVLTPGEDPNYEDALTINTRYESLHEMLVSEGLVDWTTEDEIPAYAEEPMAAMVASMSATDFALPVARVAQLHAEGAYGLTPPSWAEKQLRNQRARGFVYSPQRTTYY